jgi:hypothetical protein
MLHHDVEVNSNRCQQNGRSRGILRLQPNHLLNAKCVLCCFDPTIIRVQNSPLRTHQNPSSRKKKRHQDERVIAALPVKTYRCRGIRRRREGAYASVQSRRKHQQEFTLCEHHGLV